MTETTLLGKEIQAFLLVSFQGLKELKGTYLWESSKATLESNIKNMELDKSRMNPFPPPSIWIVDYSHFALICFSAGHLYEW